MVDNKLAITYFGQGFDPLHRRKMKFVFSSILACKLLIVSLLLIGTSVQAQQARVYSTEGYCILAYEQVDTDYLKLYEQKLGFRPKVKLCNRVNKLVSEFRPKKWNYKFGQAYPGSSIYLSPEQVEKIKQAKGALVHAKR